MSNSKMAGLNLALILSLVSSNILALSYDDFSFYETPIAYETDNGVIELNSLIDVGYRSDDNDNDRYDTLRGAIDLTYKTQLKNDWDVSIQYLADYQNERYNGYEDLLRVSISDQWGNVQFGNVASLVFEQTKREESVGILGLGNDDFTLSLESYGVFYQWNTPSLSLMASLDKEGNVVAGLSFYKPVGGMEYIFSVRANDIELDKGDAQGVSSNQGLAIIGQVQRGRWVADVQYLSEELAFLSSRNKFTLDAFSAGLNYAFNRWQLSLSGLVRENELNDEERTVALGLRFDIARGLSVNAGLSVKNSKLFSERYKSLATSVTYEF